MRERGTRERGVGHEREGWGMRERSGARGRGVGHEGG